MDLKNCEKLISKHIGEHGRLDILVNNASKQIMAKDIAEIDVCYTSIASADNITDIV